jgi:hypothetical protein
MAGLTLRATALSQESSSSQENIKLASKIFASGSAHSLLVGCDTRD